MDFTEGSRGIYRPIRVLFDTPIYERALQTCWHVGSYKSQIALVAELLRLQQKYQLSSEVTAEDMTELLLEESKSTVRVKLWEFELEDFDEDVIPLLRLVWEVNNNMKRRDVEFEARRLLNSPETIPPQFQHPKIISQAHKYAKSLTEQHQQIRSSKLLCPREVVMEVVPKVVQGFWLPPPNTSFNMPSKQLSKMAVGVTKAVEDRVSTTLPSMLLQVSFSRFIRNDVVLSIQEKVRQGYTKDVLMKMLNCFSAKVLKTISDVAAAEICVLFQPQTHTKMPPNLKPREDCTQPADVVDLAEAKTSSAVMTPPPAPPTLAITANTGLDEAEEQPVPSSELDSAVATTPAAPVSPADESPVISAVQDDLTASAESHSNSSIHNGLNNSLDEAEEEPTSSPQPDSSALSPPPAPLTFATETPANTGLDEAEEQPVLSPESAVIPPPPAPLTPSPEPPVNAANTPKTQGPTFSPEPDSTFVIAPPPPVTPPADESPAISAVQDDLIFMQQPVRVDESFTTTTEVKKTKRRRFSRFFGWLRKNICCCFLSEDTEAE
ncbi:uncharacterized protein LOC108887413 [Lates calcarifer]|uniref:Uncharacterized protein LOC108887413 n=1 Tax=Lates calcarifer TaxID=8187 RepID=A0AAJ8BGE9_LATCA|nr:uncharacterized protein LOC108887413 [Lates calcarifer]